MTTAVLEEKKGTIENRDTVLHQICGWDWDTFHHYQEELLKAVEAGDRELYDQLWQEIRLGFRVEK